jgi:hypothetical protein
MKLFNVQLTLSAANAVDLLQRLGAIAETVTQMYLVSEEVKLVPAEVPEAPAPAPKPTRGKGKAADTSAAEKSSGESSPAEKPSDPAASTTADAPAPAPAPAETPAPAPAETPAPAPAEHVVTLTEVRAFLSNFLVNPVTSPKVSELIVKHGGTKLSTVPVQNLATLLIEAKAMFK